MSNEGTAFLRAIRESPDDPLIRLVYADWLEEQGDPRGIWLRLEERQRSLPIWDEECVRLHREQLSLQYRPPADWLREIDRHLPRTLLGDGWPEDTLARWRVIERLAEWKFRGQITTIDVDEDVVRTMEASLGIRLPLSVQWNERLQDRICRVGEMGNYPLFADRDHTIRWLEAERFLAIHDEMDYLWGVMEADLGLDDPPVCAFHRDDPRTEWTADPGNPVDLRLTDWSLSDLMFASVAGNRTLDRWIDGERNRASFPGSLDGAFPNRLQLGRVVYYESPGCIVTLTILDEEHERDAFSVAVHPDVALEDTPSIVRGWFAEVSDRPAIADRREGSP